ncbi:MAG: DUF5597 domain-containing protein [Bacteroides sp.]|nr:DUF5597 domain-containing protein [Bacteroides sp.]
MLFEEGETERVLEKNGFRFICRHDHRLGWNPQAKDGSEWPATGAVIMELSPTEYLVGGTGVVLTFESTRNNKYAGIGYIDKVKVETGKIVPIQRLNGDQNHQGHHLRIPAGTWGMQYIKLYEY